MNKGLDFGCSCRPGDVFLIMFSQLGKALEDGRRLDSSPKHAYCPGIYFGLLFFGC